MSQEIHLSGTAALDDDKLSWLVGGHVLHRVLGGRQPADPGARRDLFEALEAAPGPIYAPPGVPELPVLSGPVAARTCSCFGGAGNPAQLRVLRRPRRLRAHRAGHRQLGTLRRGRPMPSTTSSAPRSGCAIPSRRRSLQLLSPTRVRQATDVDLFNRRRLGCLLAAFQSCPSRPRTTPWSTLLRPAVSRAAASTAGRKSAWRSIPMIPETLWAYEVGWKIDAFWTIACDSTARRSTVTTEDIQFSASLNVDGTPVFVIQNAGQAEVHGFELELSATARRAASTWRPGWATSTPSTPSSTAWRRTA